MHKWFSFYFGKCAADFVACDFLSGKVQIAISCVDEFTIDSSSAIALFHCSTISILGTLC
jgi:hypothetical protein